MYSLTFWLDGVEGKNWRGSGEERFTKGTRATHRVLLPGRRQSSIGWSRDGNRTATKVPFTGLWGDARRRLPTCEGVIPVQAVSCTVMHDSKLSDVMTRSRHFVKVSKWERRERGARKQGRKQRRILRVLSFAPPSRVILTGTSSVDALRVCPASTSDRRRRPVKPSPRLVCPPPSISQLAKQGGLRRSRFV